MFALEALEKRTRLTLLLQECVIIVCSTCSTSRWAAHCTLQLVAGEETQRQGLQERLITPVKQRMAVLLRLDTLEAGTDGGDQD